MKKLVFSVSLSLVVFFSNAQTAATTSLNYKYPVLDKSPMDMIYFPDNYPTLKTQDKVKEPPVARVIYSRPQKDNRVIFGDLIEYGKVWRLGANEATEIEFFKDVFIGNKKVPKGRYTLYAIPDTSKWTLIVNKDTDTWGAFKYDQKKDLVRITEPVEQAPVPSEVFTMSFNKTNTGTDLIMSWDNVLVRLPITVK